MTSIRWLPKQGKPITALEFFSQNLFKFIAWLPVYIAIVVTLVLVLQIFVLSRLL